MKEEMGGECAGKYQCIKSVCQGNMISSIEKVLNFVLGKHQR